MRTIRISPAHVLLARLKLRSAGMMAKLVRVPAPLEKSAGESADAINELCLALEDIKKGLITLVQASEMYTKQAGDAFQQLDRTM